MADSCAGMGCLATLPAEAGGFTTVELKTNFFASAREGALRCKAWMAHGGSAIAIFEMGNARGDNIVYSYHGSWCGEGMETPWDCPSDCFCGNGRCEQNFKETSDTCPSDCPVCNNNGICEASETPTGCKSDCYCGNKQCEMLFETQLSCPQDCGEPCNNDGYCNQGETLKGCPNDCTCGNGQCDNPKDVYNQCGQECKSLCGNAKCDCFADFVNGCLQQDCPNPDVCNTP